MFQVTFTTLTCVLFLCHSTNQHVRLICQCHVLSRYFVILFSSFTFLSSIFTTWSRINSLSDGCQQRWKSTLFISDKIYKSVYPSCQVPAYVQALFLSFSLSILLSGVYHLSLSYVSAMESNMDGDVDINVDSAMHYNVDWPIRGNCKT